MHLSLLHSHSMIYSHCLLLLPEITSQEAAPAHPLSKRKLDLSHMLEAIQDLDAAPGPYFYPRTSLVLWKPPYRPI